MAEMTEQCGNCRFWKRGVSDYELGDRDEFGTRRRYPNEYGTCRRNPTHVVKREDSWCGEWTPDVETAIKRMGKETYEPRTS